MDKHYVAKKFFNNTAYFQMLKKEKDPDVLEYIENTVETCCNYVTAVDMMETQLITARFRMEQDRYQEYIKDIDAQRRRYHNDAIESTSFLNRVAAANGCENVFTGSKEDRYQVADFCMELVAAIFETRK